MQDAIADLERQVMLRSVPKALGARHDGTVRADAFGVGDQGNSIGRGVGVGPDDVVDTAHRSRGRPRIRSPMMLRWICDVPAAIDTVNERIAAPPDRPRSTRRVASVDQSHAIENTEGERRPYAWTQSA